MIRLLILVGWFLLAAGADARLRFTIYPDATPNDLSDNPRSETVYDLIGRVTDSYDELRVHTRSVYFPDGTPDALRMQQRVQVHSLGNLVTSYTYDGAGHVVSTTDPRGNTVTNQYDNEGRSRFVNYPATDENAATQTETRYDAAGRRVAMVDQEGKVTRYRYDGVGRLVEVRQYLDQALAGSDADFHLAGTTAGVVSTNYTYDEAGNQVTQVDALGRVTTFWTDNMGRRTKRLLPKDATESAYLTDTLHYDGWGNQDTRTDFAGKTTTFTYDVLNRLTRKSADPTHPSLVYSNANARIEYDYDAAGLRSAARTYNAANTPLYAETTPHDERGRLRYKDTGSNRLSYSYYANNLLAGTTSATPNGLSVGYRYDDLNRLAAVDDSSAGLATRTTGYTYNPNGSLESMTQPNAVTHTYSYDALNRLRNLVVANGSSLIHTYEYKLKPTGHRQQVIENVNKTTTYTYDDLYRLTAETVANDPHGNSGTIGYSLDKVGNRLSRDSEIAAILPSANTYNARDWLSGDTYNPDGSTRSGKLSVAALQGTDSNDFEENLIHRQRPDGGVIDVTYDADGIRVSKSVTSSSLTTSTFWTTEANNLTGYPQVVEEVTTSTSSVTTRSFVYGLSLISYLISMDSSPAIPALYSLDGHGSVREALDASGAVTAAYDYDAYGNLINHSGVSDNNYRFGARQSDADLGLYYNLSRYLNTETGRFWSMDSFDGEKEWPLSLHRFIYGNVDPVTFVDPDGRYSRLDAAIIGMWVHTFIGLDFKRGNPLRRSNTSFSSIFGDLDPIESGVELLRPDLVDLGTSEVYEIKPNNLGNGRQRAVKQVMNYIGAFAKYGKVFQKGVTYQPPPEIPPPPLNSDTLIEASRKDPGVILYTLSQKGPGGTPSVVTITAAAVVGTQLAVKAYQLVSGATKVQAGEIEARIDLSVATRGF